MRKTRSSRRTMHYLVPPCYGYPSFSHLGMIEMRAWDAFEEETWQLYVAGGYDDDKPCRRRVASRYFAPTSRMSRCIKLTRELVPRTRNASVDTSPTRTRDVPA